MHIDLTPREWLMLLIVAILLALAMCQPRPKPRVWIVEAVYQIEMPIEERGFGVGFRGTI